MLGVVQFSSILATERIKYDYILNRLNNLREKNNPFITKNLIFKFKMEINFEYIEIVIY